MSTPRKALVIGSEGNIGAPLVRYLRAHEYDVMESDIRPGWRDRFVMADINHPVDLLPAFDWGPDVVFLLSAMVSQSPHRWLALAVFGVLFVWVVVAVPVRVARSKTLLAVARRRALAARASTGASDPVRDAIGRRRSDAPPCEAGDPAESNPL